MLIIIIRKVHSKCIAVLQSAEVQEWRLCRRFYFSLPLCCFSPNSWYYTSNVSYFHWYLWTFSHNSFVVNRVLQEMTVLDSQLPLTVWLHKLTYCSCKVLRDTYKAHLIPLLLWSVNFWVCMFSWSTLDLSYYCSELYIFPTPYLL